MDWLHALWLYNQNILKLSTNRKRLHLYCFQVEKIYQQQFQSNSNENNKKKRNKLYRYFHKFYIKFSHQCNSIKLIWRIFFFCASVKEYENEMVGFVWWFAASVWVYLKYATHLRIFCFLLFFAARPLSLQRRWLNT